MSTTRTERLTLGEFASWTSGPIVSVFLGQDPAHTDLDAIRTKAAYQWSLEELVRSFSLPDESARSLLAPLLDATRVGPARRRGTAWFLAPDRCAALPLQGRTDDIVSIGTTPDLVTLLPHLDSGPEYFALAISQHRVRVFRADRFEIEPVPVPDLPKSLEDALWYVRREPTLERHGSGMAHQSGGGQNLHKDDIHQFLHLVDKAITTHLNGSHAPLVVMGVGYEASMFINESHYRYIVSTPVTGNPDSIDIATIHARTLDIARTVPGAAAAAAERVRSLAGTGKALTRLDEIVEAASAGAVDQLLIARSELEMGDRRGRLGADRATLCTAISTSAAAGGQVHLVDGADLPGGTTVAAILRY